METTLGRRDFLANTALLLLLPFAGCTDRVAGNEGDDAERRNLSFGLWAGVPGASFGSAVDVTAGSRRIRGSFAWTHPVTGEQLQVYERINHDKDGLKRQLFTLRPDGAALARVFDSRPGQADRVFVNDAFFPLGPWRNGEHRSYPLSVHQAGSKRRYSVAIHVRKISYTYDKVPGSLNYDWILTDDTGQKRFHERFIYSPGIGFVKFSNHLT